jgi:hypothetical protein
LDKIDCKCGHARLRHDIGFFNPYTYFMYPTGCYGKNATDYCLCRVYVRDNLKYLEMKYKEKQCQSK